MDSTAAAAPGWRRRPVLAAVLSLLLPGLGHVYAGRFQRGLALWAAMMVGAVAALALPASLPEGPVRFLPWLTMFAAYAAVAVDAWRTAARTPPEWRPRRYNRWYVYVALYVVVGMVASGALQGWIRANVTRAYSIPSPSMEPTILEGDYVMTRPGAPRPVPRGLVAVHVRPLDGLTVVQRVIGLPGDTVAMRGHRAVVNGRPLHEPYARIYPDATGPVDIPLDWQAEFLAPGVDRASYRPTAGDWGPLVVPPGQLLLLADHRQNAIDGRFTGFVPQETVTGRVAWIYFSRGRNNGRIRWDRIGKEVR